MGLEADLGSWCVCERVPRWGHLLHPTLGSPFRHSLRTICTVLLDPRDPLLHSGRTQGFAADPDYCKGEVFAYVGSIQNLKDLKDKGPKDRAFLHTFLRKGVVFACLGCVQNLKDPMDMPHLRISGSPFRRSPRAFCTTEMDP